MHPLLRRVPAASVGHPEQPGATLVNRTGRSWKLRPVNRQGYWTPIVLSQGPGGVRPRTMTTGFNEEVPPTIELGPDSELRFSHRPVPGQWFRTSFVLVEADGEPPAALYVTYRTRPRWFSRSRFHTSLGGFSHPGDDLPGPFRLRRGKGSTLVLEPMPPGP